MSDPTEWAEERYAEDAWLRAAEGGDPETWAESERDRMAALDGFGPPPGW